MWAREVREASYDMEDVLDTFLVRVDGGEPTDPSRLQRAMKKMGKVFSKARLAVVLLVPSKTSRRIMRS